MATGVGRFQVMATLQAARAKAMGLSEESAKSWGLNRAIFYAAAKRGFKSTGPPGPAKAPKGEPAVVEFHLGEDKAYAVTVRGRTLFTIGGEVQQPDDFERQIAQRFASTFEKAWDEALKLVRRYPRDVLASPTAFYDLVYRPRRDDLARAWTERAEARSQPASPSASRKGVRSRRITAS